MRKFLFLVPLFAVLGAPAAWSQAATAHEHAHATAPAAPATFADGEIRKVDKAAGKVTIKHGEIKALNMPPMTMVYPVTNVAMLDKVKAGDKVQFSAVSQGGNLTVTAIRPAK